VLYHTAFNISVNYYLNSYFKDHEVEEQLKAKTGVGTME